MTGKLLLNPATEDGVKRLMTSLPHAVGIQGADESGKKYLSKHLAGQILGVDDVVGHPYSLIIDCGEKTGIEDIREAIGFLKLKIPGDKTIRRCLLFWSFEKLGAEAQNALLKTLEEPPRDTVIILTAASRRTLPPTIVSRLSWLDLLPVNLDQAKTYFKNTYETTQVEKAYLLSAGKPAMTIRLLENYDEHPLVKAITETKKLLKSDRFSRLSRIDSLTKDKDFDVDLYLESLSKILEVLLMARIKKSDKVDRKMLDDLKRVMKARDSKKYSANNKLLLSDIFYNL